MNEGVAGVLLVVFWSIWSILVQTTGHGAVLEPGLKKGSEVR